MLVLFSDLYIIVPLSYIEFREYTSVFHCGDSGRYERYGIVVSNRQLVRPPIVLHWSSLAILLFEEEERGYEVSLVGFRLFDVLLFLHVINPLSQRGLFHWRRGVNFAVKRVG